MLGYPGESTETIAMTRAFLRETPLTIMNLTKFTPYPGSPVYRDLYGTSIRDDHWQKMNGMNFLWAPEGMSIEDIEREYRKMLVAFYSKPRVNWYYLRFSLRHPAHLLRLVRFGAAFAMHRAGRLRRALRGELADNPVVNLD